VNEVQYFIDRCVQMPVGTSLVSKTLGVTVHHYRNSWLIMPITPLASHDLGRETPDAVHLALILSGDWRYGNLIRVQSVYPLPDV